MPLEREVKSKLRDRVSLANKTNVEEVAAEVEVVVLRLDRLVVGAGRREGRLELELAVDEERRGSAPAQE